MAENQIEAENRVQKQKSEQPYGTAFQPIERLATGLLGSGDIMRMQHPEVMQTAVQAWRCKCGVMNTLDFCAGCARPREGVPPIVLFPAAAENVWECSCGHKETSNFCSNCGKPRPKT